jgi:hypothetical protein
LTTTSNNYPSHKTFSFNDGKAMEQKKVVVEQKTTESVVVATTNNYPLHKTITISAEQTTVTTETIVTNSKTEEKVVSATDSYPTYKTHTIEADKVENAVSSTTETVEKSQDTKEIKQELPPENKQQEQNSSSYPAHKTVNLSAVDNVVKEQSAANTREISKTLTPVIESQKEVSKEETVSPINKPSETVNPEKISIQLGAYPAAKTFYFVKEETVTVPVTEKVKTPETVINSKQNTVVTTNKASTIKKTDTEEPTYSKSKSPAPWIIGIAAVLLTAAATYWISQNQQGSLKDEITELKQRNDSLATSVKKLQKELHFDDLIAKGGKLDAKNNITVRELASESEVIRTCFSIAANPRALNGKKIIYLRLVDANNKVITHSTNDTFDFNGEKTPYTLKREIEFKKDELMLCIDYKLEQKLAKGTYKAEIYNEGILDGTASFELK